jgi:hypothetical protein
MIIGITPVELSLRLSTESFNNTKVSMNKLAQLGRNPFIVRSPAWLKYLNKA